MTEYSFVLKYRLLQPDVDMDALLERLGEAGCTDALVGIGVVGRLALDFTREADSARHAMSSALAEVKDAIPSAILVEAAPDLVGLSDIAAHVGVTLQNVREFMLSHADFPMPVYDGSVSLWHLADVMVWTRDKKGYRFEAALLETAMATLAVNVAKDARRSNPDDEHAFEGLVA